MVIANSLIMLSTISQSVHAGYYKFDNHDKADSQ